jgi:excisionase family DNA binding protein
MSKMETQLSAREVAAVLNISLRTFEKLISEGGAPPFYKIGRSRRWDPGVVREWINERCIADSASVQENEAATTTR